MADYRKNVASHLANIDAWLKASRDALNAGKDFPVQPKLADTPNPDFGSAFGYAEGLVPYASKACFGIRVNPMATMTCRSICPS